MTAERVNYGFEPISVKQEEVAALKALFGSFAVDDILILPDTEALGLITPQLQSTNFRLRTVIVKTGEVSGNPVMEIHQRHAAILTLNDPEKKLAWASAVGTDQEPIPLQTDPDEMEIRRTGSFVDLNLKFDPISASWNGEGRTLYKEEDPAALINLAMTLVDMNKTSIKSGLPVAAL